jgi:hypothetical protein
MSGGNTTHKGPARSRWVIPYHSFTFKRVSRDNKFLNDSVNSKIEGVYDETVTICLKFIGY